MDSRNIEEQAHPTSEHAHTTSRYAVDLESKPPNMQVLLQRNSNPNRTHCEIRHQSRNCVPCRTKVQALQHQRTHIKARNQHHLFELQQQEPHGRRKRPGFTLDPPQQQIYGHESYRRAMHRKAVTINLEGTAIGE